MATPADYGLLLLRFALGVPFINRGWANFKKLKGFGRILGIVEWLAGLLVVLGVFVKVALVVAMLILAGSICISLKRKIGFKSTVQRLGWDFDFVLLLLAIALYILGSGTIVISW